MQNFIVQISDAHDVESKLVNKLPAKRKVTTCTMYKEYCDALIVCYL